MNAKQAFDILPSDISKALGPAAVASIYSITHTTRKNGDLVINIRREGVNGREQWVASPKLGASWKCEGAVTRVKLSDV